MRKKGSDSQTNYRQYLIVSVFVVLFVLVDVKLFNIQVLNHEKFALAAKDQHWGSTEVPAKRGDVFSADGYLLAGTETYYLLYAEPKAIQNKKELAERLALYFSSQPLLIDSLEASSSAKESPEDRYKSKVTSYEDALNKDLLWIALEHNLSPDQKNQIEILKLTGIGFQEEPIRFYPEGYLAAHVLGFVASNSRGEKQGYYGIEGFFNENLKGRAGKLTEEVDPSGVPILIGDYRETEAVPGSTMYLTINRAVQNIVEKKLKEGVEKYDAKSGTVIVMDPYTGDVVAMANYPTFIPSYFGEVSEDPKAYRKSIEYRNLAIAEMYEPGSVMKPLTISSAVELGLVSEETTYQDSGPVQYSGEWIDNWDKKHWGTLNIIQLLQKSNNIGAAWVGTKVGARSLTAYLAKFGIGSKSGIDLEGEDTGSLRDYKDYTAIDLANISFGQGILATPLQVLNAFNVFANGGFLMQPRIVEKVADGRKLTEMPPRTVRKVISKQTAERMVSMLEKAAEGGEAQFFVLKNYRISGKTGTAQIYGEHGYDFSRSNATFAGFLTGSRKFSMIVKLQEPRLKIYASESAVPMWMDIAGELVKYYDLPPDRAQPAPVSDQ
jgi:cell division protein FtsI/penicillin-binding protein 2